MERKVDLQWMNAMSFLKPYVNIRAKNAESNFQPSHAPILTNQSNTNVDAFQPENDVQLVVKLPSQNTVSGAALPETSTMELPLKNPLRKGHKHQ